jgi:hypothetical protein
MKKALYAALALAILAGTLAGTAFAKENENNQGNGPLMRGQNSGVKMGWEKNGGPANNPEDNLTLAPAAEIRQNGTFVLRRATVTAYNPGSSITVQAWGFTMGADISSAKIEPMNASGTPVTIAVGDRVTIEGTLTNNVAKATLVRDLSQIGQNNVGTLNRIQELLKLLNQLRAKLGQAPITM